MSVELVGIGSANRGVLSEMPALITPKAFGHTRTDEADPSHLCLISQVDGELVVWDLDGQGGLSVNGSQVRRAMLKESDTLRLGGREFRVHTDPQTGRYLRGVRS